MSKLSWRHREENEDAQSNLIKAQHNILPLIKISKQANDPEWEGILKTIFKLIQRARRTLKKQRDGKKK